MALELAAKVEHVLRSQAVQSRIGITISEVVLGGSVAYGTAVQGNYDVDLVAFSPSLHPKQGKVSEDGYSTILAKLKIYLLEHLTGRYVPQEMEKQFHGWRFTANYLQVDLQISPQWEDPNLEDMYSYMRDMHPDRRILFSCGTAKYKNSLMEGQPRRAKILIKRIKVWRDSVWDGKVNGCPKSFFLSILVLISYHRAPQHLLSDATPLKTLAKWVARDIQELVQHIRMDPNLDLHVPGENQVIMRKYSHCLPDKPRIIDPANPFKNFYKQGLCQIEPQKSDSCEKRWDIFARQIASLNLVMNVV
ncbi:uncharacterized protein LOC135339739 isoform X2 [Halichondria panicea]